MHAEWFAERLRELRAAAGLTQQQLADRAGLTREGVAQLETRRTEPAWRTVVALCQALGVGSDEFLKPPAMPPGPRPKGRPRKVASLGAGDAGGTEGPGDAPAEEPAPAARGATQKGKPGSTPKTPQGKKRE